MIIKDIFETGIRNGWRVEFVSPELIVTGCYNIVLALEYPKVLCIDACEYAIETFGQDKLSLVSYGMATARTVAMYMTGCGYSDEAEKIVKKYYRSDPDMPIGYRAYPRKISVTSLPSVQSKGYDAWAICMQVMAHLMVLKSQGIAHNALQSPGSIKWVRSAGVAASAKVICFYDAEAREAFIWESDYIVSIHNYDAAFKCSAIEPTMPLTESRRKRLPVYSNDTYVADGNKTDRAAAAAVIAKEVCPKMAEIISAGGSFKKGFNTRKKQRDDTPSKQQQWSVAEAFNYYTSFGKDDDMFVFLTTDIEKIPTVKHAIVIGCNTSLISNPSSNI